MITSEQNFLHSRINAAAFVFSLMTVWQFLFLTLLLTAAINYLDFVVSLQWSPLFNVSLYSSMPVIHLAECCEEVFHGLLMLLTSPEYYFLKYTQLLIWSNHWFGFHLLCCFVYSVQTAQMWRLNALAYIFENDVFFFLTLQTNNFQQ